jgi:hypothetical protein
VTVAFELGAADDVGRRTRAVVALGLFAHANIYVLTPILYWESMVFLPLFDCPQTHTRAETVPVSAAEFPSTFAAHRRCSSCALVATVIRGAVADAQSARAVGDGTSVASALSNPPPLRQIGPFAVGHPLLKDGRSTRSRSAMSVLIALPEHPVAPCSR